MKYNDFMNLKDELLKNDYSLIASNGYYSFDKGIKPVLMKVNEKRDYFKDLEVVDRVIGKASAMLLVYSGVKHVYGLLLSEAGKDILEKYHIPYQYDELVDYIENDKRDGMCPMELTVKDIDDLEAAYNALNDKVKQLMSNK